jgi:hypothetical protein
LTFARPTSVSDRPWVVSMLQAFGKRLARRMPGIRWLAVLELHPGGHGWHVHMVVSRYVPKAIVRAIWHHGHIDVRLIAGPGVKDSLSAARKAASYVAKYIAKDVGATPRERGEHRYYRSESMPITVIEAEGEFVTLVTQVWAHFGNRIGWVWWSGDDPDWRGPRVLAIRSG